MLPLSRPLLLLGLAFASLSPVPLHASTAAFEAIKSFPLPAWSLPTMCNTRLLQASDGNFYGGGNGGPDGLPLFLRITPAGDVTILHTFEHQNSDSMVYPPVQGPDGAFYGVETDGAGASNKGLLFRITPAGEYTTLYTFDGTVAQGAVWPAAGLTLGPDGNFYGTTSGGGGSENGGIAFRLTPQGEFTVLASFTQATGTVPDAELLLAADGNFYGVAQVGGSKGAGTIFRMTPAGEITCLHNVAETIDFEDSSSSPLVQNADGSFTGTTQRGGDYGEGSIFQLAADGTFSVLYSFDMLDARPSGGLVRGLDSQLYGATLEGGGPESVGSIFRVGADGKPVMLAEFDFEQGPPAAPIWLLAGKDGNFYGAGLDSGARDGGGLFKMTPDGVVTSFMPFAPTIHSNDLNTLTRTADGNLYGTTAEGGEHERGTAFRIAPDGTLTTLASFSGPSPSTALLPGADGNFYGLASAVHSAERPFIYRLSPSGLITHLFTFTGNNGFTPEGFIAGPDGNFYGAHSSNTVYRMTPDGEMTTVATFGLSSEVSVTLLTIGRDGSVYGNRYPRGGGHGSIFRIAPDGAVTTLVELDPALTGDFVTSMTEGDDGNFYGTLVGLQFHGYGGGIFRLTPNGEYSILYAPYNPANPPASVPFQYALNPSSLVQGGDGNLYGIQSDGGWFARGLLFRLTPAGQYTLLRTFNSESGFGPSSLTRGQDGNIYGATYFSSSPSAGGQVYRLRLDSGPSPLEAWLAAQTPDGYPDGDEDHDGVSNLQEYAFGTDPHSTTNLHAAEQGGTLLSHGLPVMRAAADPATGKPAAIFARRKDRDASNIQYLLQFSSDLKNWGTFETIPAVLATDDDFEVVSVPAPDSYGPVPGIYFRVMIAAP